MKLPLFGRARARLATSADVEAEIAEHRRILGEATAALAALDATRSGTLIGDDLSLIREHRTRSDELRLAIDRLEARLLALDVQAVEIAAAEARKALDARRAAVEARAADGVAWLQEVYPEIAHALVSGLQSLQEVEREVLAVNTAMTEAGRDAPELPGVQARLGIFIGGAGLDAGSPLASGSATSLGGSVHLPALEGGVRAEGWTPRAWS